MKAFSCDKNLFSLVFFFFSYSKNKWNDFVNDSVHVSRLSLFFRRLYLYTLITCISGRKYHNRKNVEANVEM